MAENTKKNTVLNVVVGILCAAACIYFTADAVKDMKEEKRKNDMTIAELVEKLQADLPVKATGSACTIIQTGLEISNDTLIFFSTIEMPDSYRQQFVKTDFQKQFYADGLNSVVKEYGTHLLTRKACDAGMVLTYRYFDAEGTQISRTDFAPEVYRPLLQAR